LRRLICTETAFAALQSARRSSKINNFYCVEFMSHCLALWIFGCWLYLIRFCEFINSASQRNRRENDWAKEFSCCIAGLSLQNAVTNNTQLKYKRKNLYDFHPQFERIFLKIKYRKCCFLCFKLTQIIIIFLKIKL